MAQHGKQRGSSNKNLALNQRKERAAGRGADREDDVKQIRQRDFDRGKTKGAFGRENVANRSPEYAEVGRSNKPPRSSKT